MINPVSTVPTRCCVCVVARLAAATVFAFYLPGILNSARADVAIQGAIDAVQVNARDSSVAEVLAALGQSFDLQYRKSADLNRPVNGSFEGPLAQVISRLLQGYDYVLKYSDAGPAEIVLIKSSAKRAEQSPASTPAPIPQPAPVAAQATNSNLPFRPPASYSRTFERTPPPGTRAASR